MTRNVTERNTASNSNRPSSASGAPSTVMATVLGAVLVFIFTLFVGRIGIRLYRFAQTYRRWREITSKLPHHPVHWLFGNLDATIKGQNDLLRKCEVFSEQGAKMYIFWMGFFNPVVSLCHPDTIKPLLKSSEQSKPMELAGYQFLVEWLGGGLLLSNGKKWELHRRLLTPAFHFDILKQYLKKFNRVADTLTSKFAALVENGESVDVCNHITLATLDGLLQCALSYDDNVQTQGVTHPYANAVMALYRAVISRAMYLPHYIDLIYFNSTEGRKFMKNCKFVRDFAADVIAKRRKMLEADPEILQQRRLDFLDILLAARDSDGQGLKDKDIIDEINTFTFAGHDTTESAINWTLFCLAKYQDMQEKVYQEVETLLFANGDDVQWDDLSKLQYMPLFIKEVMRFYPTVPMVARGLENDLQVGDVTLCKGMEIHINFLHLHKHKDLWEDPQEFRPERFAKENFAGMDPYIYIPFVAGPRNCIGQNFALLEIKVLVAKILHNFHLDVDPEKPPVPFIEVTMRSETGIHLKMTPRHKV